MAKKDEITGSYVTFLATGKIVPALFEILKSEEDESNAILNGRMRLTEMLEPYLPEICAAYIREVQKSLGDVPVFDVEDLLEILDEKTLSFSIKTKMERRRSINAHFEELTKKGAAKAKPVVAKKTAAKKTPAKKSTKKGAK